MSSIAYNLFSKLVWIVSRIRHIDDAGKIMEWIAAMTAMNKLLNEMDMKNVYRTPLPHRMKSEKVLKMTWSQQRVKI